MHAKDKSSARRESIQILRAVACLAVLQVHFLPFLPFTNLAYAGAIGVDLFFVISGYIIAMSLETTQGPVFALRFLVNRVARVVPYYWLLTALAIVAIFAGLEQGRGLEWREIGRSFLFVPTFPNPLLFVGWTLSHEMFFYGICALTAMIVGRRLGLIAAVFGAVLAASLLLPGSRYWAGFVKASLNWEFLLGFLAYMYRHELGRIFRARVVAIASVVLFAAVPFFSTDWGLTFDAFTYRHDSVVVGSTTLPRLVVWGIPSLLLFLAAVAHEEEVRRYKLFWPIRIGDASYSIYLIQAFTILPLPLLVALGAPVKMVASVGLIVLTVILALQARRIEDWLNRVSRDALLRWLRVPSTGRGRSRSSAAPDALSTSATAQAGATNSQ